MDKATEEDLLRTVAQLEERLKALDAAGASEASVDVHKLLTSKLEDLAGTLIEYVRVHPGRSVAIAFLIGVVIASRRGGR